MRNYGAVIVGLLDRSSDSVEKMMMYPVAWVKLTLPDGSDGDTYIPDKDGNWTKEAR